MLKKLFKTINLHPVDINKIDEKMANTSEQTKNGVCQSLYFLLLLLLFKMFIELLQNYLIFYTFRRPVRISTFRIGR